MEGKKTDIDVDISSLTDEQLEKLEDVLYRRATQTETTLDIKTHRLLNIPEGDRLLLNSQLEQSPELARRFEEEGVMFKQEITIKQHLPDGAIGRWMHEHLKNKIQKLKLEKGK